LDFSGRSGRLEDRVAVGAEQTHWSTATGAALTLAHAVTQTCVYVQVWEKRMVLVRTTRVKGKSGFYFAKLAEDNGGPEQIDLDRTSLIRRKFPCFH